MVIKIDTLAILLNLKAQLRRVERSTWIKTMEKEAGMMFDKAKDGAQDKGDWRNSTEAIFLIQHIGDGDNDCKLYYNCKNQFG